MRRTDCLHVITRRISQNVGNDCIRAWWTALAPASVVVFNIARLLYKKLPERYRPLSSIFSEFLPLSEAVSLLNDGKIVANGDIPEGDWDLGHQWKKAQWQKGVLIVPALLETVYWGFWTCNLAINVLTGIKPHGGHVGVASSEVTMTVLLALSYELAVGVLLTLSWLYGSLRPFFLKKEVFTVPYDLFSLYLSMLVVTGLNGGAIIYEQYTRGSQGPPTSYGTALDLMTHTLLLFVLLGTILSLPLDTPPQGVDTEKIGSTITPEDYTSLAGWITFWWIYPIVKRVCPIYRTLQMSC
jgi:hypothetical protein